MKNESYNEEEVGSQLRHLSRESQVAFALSCCERMFPNYHAFQQHHGWGDANVLRSGIDYGWSWLTGGGVEAGKGAEDLRNACESQAPDTEDFPSIYVSPALDAASAVTLLLDLIRDGDSTLAVDIATLSRDTVDMYVQELEQMPANSPGLEDRIRLHPLMQVEIERQYNDIEQLSLGVTPAEAKQKWRMPELGSIGLK